ncbi:gastrin/cholecystokinin type B receptor-like [Patiria miniata]|uniref:G-protein coupled receptors family 1 profile domain-containing protein n=1 Tax=Patiria miniata TaxID=46514 RepID=A0A913ZRD3_PATMI|nr:gastrin/cholecystokinin type B receptor-like [Patiria miniata]
MEDHSKAIPTLPHKGVLPTAVSTAAGGDTFTLVVHVIVFLIGVPGNCLILRVYWTKAHKTSTHVFIMALAWADLAVCMQRWHRVSEEAILLAGGHETPRVILIAWAFTNSFIGVSVLMTAVIAADRYDCVCRARNRFFTKKRAQVTVIITFVFSFVINIPAFYLALSTDPSNAVVRMLVFAFQIVLFVTALVMIAVCYQLVYMAIRKHVKVGVHSKAGLSVGGHDGERCCSDVSGTARSGVSWSVEMDVKTSPLKMKGLSTIKGTDACSSSRAIPGTSSDRKAKGEQTRKVKAVNLQRKTTRMLFITSAVFVLTWLPYWTYIAVEYAFLGGAPIHPTFRRMLKSFSFACLFINNVVNPLIYGIANRRFRQDCKEVLKKLRLC